jgi:hypothetical protein
VTGCSTKPALPDYRYRLTVEVETPQGLRTGSSVIQIASHISSSLSLRPGDVTTQVTGEAVAVDLPGGKVLFALLTRPGSAEGAENYAFDALIGTPWSGADEYVRDVNALIERRDVGVLPRFKLPPWLWAARPGEGKAPPVEVIDKAHYPRTPAYPLLVTFGDLRDPKSVVAIDPDHLDQQFGPGIKLRRITVQMTDDAVTTGIEKRLGWLSALYNGGMLGSGTFFHPQNPTLDLAYINFKRGH